MSALAAEHLEVSSPAAQHGKISGWDDERIRLIEKAIQSFQHWTEKMEERFSRLEDKVLTNKSKLTEIHGVLELLDLQGPEEVPNAEATEAAHRDRTSKEVSSSALGIDLRSLRQRRGLESVVDILNVKVENGLNQDMDESESELESTSRRTVTTEIAKIAVSKGSKSAAKKRKGRSRSGSQVRPKRAPVVATTSANKGPAAKSRNLKANPEKRGCYKCKTCGKSFLKIESYKDDQRYHSLGKLKCHLCSYECITRRSFQQHFQTTHTGCAPTKFPPFKLVVPKGVAQIRACPFKGCAKTFSSNTSLKSHLKYHSGETFKCTLCMYETPRRDHLDRHTRAMHSKPSQLTEGSGQATPKFKSLGVARASKSMLNSINPNAVKTTNNPLRTKSPMKIKLTFPFLKSARSKRRPPQVTKSAGSNKNSVVPTIHRRRQNSEQQHRPSVSITNKNSSPVRATRTTKNSLSRVSGDLFHDVRSPTEDSSSTRTWEQLESPLVILDT